MLYFKKGICAMNALTTRQQVSKPEAFLDRIGNGRIPRRNFGRAAFGFTLIELLLVMVILAVLAALVVPRMVGYGPDAQKKAAALDIHNIGEALNTFEVTNSRFPTNDEGLNALVVQPEDCPNWKKVLDAVPVDPWGHQYHYQTPGTNDKDFDLSSDGPPGGQPITN
jgi:general secretion pathway protein G